MYMYQYGLTIVVLTVCTYTDIRYRKIYRTAAAAYLALAALGHFATGDGTPVSFLAGMVPGLGFLLLSVAAKEEMGYGDGLLILACGFSLGFEFCMGFLLLAFLGAGIWAALLLVFRKGTRKSKIPLVPFLLAGAVLEGLLLIKFRT